MAIDLLRMRPPFSLYPCRHVLPPIGRVLTHYGRGGAVQDMGPNQRGRKGLGGITGDVLVATDVSPLPPTLNSVVRNFGVSAAECWELGDGECEKKH